MLHKIISGILLLFAIGGSAYSPSPLETPAQSLPEDAAEVYYFNDLTEFSTTDIDGNPVTQDVFRNKDVTVVHFWSPDCIDCLQELSRVKEAQQTLPDNAQLITVVIHDKEFWAGEAKQYLNKHDITAQTLMLGDGDLRTARDLLTWIPTTLIVNSSGELMCEGLVGGLPERWAEKATELASQLIS